MIYKSDMHNLEAQYGHQHIYVQKSRDCQQNDRNLKFIAIFRFTPLKNTFIYEKKRKTN